MLDISECGLWMVPSCVLALRALRHLDVARCFLLDLPSGPYLRGLTELDLSYQGAAMGNFLFPHRVLREARALQTLGIAGNKVGL